MYVRSSIINLWLINLFPHPESDAKAQESQLKIFVPLYMANLTFPQTLKLLNYTVPSFRPSLFDSNDTQGYKTLSLLCGAKRHTSY